MFPSSFLLPFPSFLFSGDSQSQHRQLAAKILHTFFRLVQKRLSVDATFALDHPIDGSSAGLESNNGNLAEVVPQGLFACTSSFFFCFLDFLMGFGFLCCCAKVSIR
jgi:hypothetical protein